MSFMASLKTKRFSKPRIFRAAGRARELSQLVSSSGKRARTPAFSSAEHFAKIIVSQCHLDVEIEEAVQVIGRYGSMKVFAAMFSQVAVERFPVSRLEHFFRRGAE